MKQIKLIMITIVAVFTIAVCIKTGSDGHQAQAVVVASLVLMAFIAGIMTLHKKKEIYHMEDDDLRDAVEELDDGFLIKPATLRYLIERSVNKDRSTADEYSMELLRRRIENKTEGGVRCDN